MLRTGGAVSRLVRGWALLSRPVTLGVRLAAFDDDGAVCLVRHTYRRGWYLPGGAVDPGETADAAVRREAQEEAGLEPASAPRLLGAYYNRLEGRDHVLLYRVDGVARPARRAPSREIAEVGFFAPAALPEDATPATRRRLAELATGGPYGGDW